MTPPGDPTALAGKAWNPATTPDLTPPGPFVLDPAVAMDWLTRDRRPRVIVDPGLRLLWANDAARRDLRDDSPVIIEDGRLRFADTRGEAHWRNFFAGLDTDGARVAITAPDGHRCVVVSAVAHQRAAERTILMKITLGRPKLDFADSGLAAQYGLTPAERQVGELLAEPTPPARIARELGISVHTVRAHIRQIYAKLAVHSQPQFLRLAHTYCST